MTVFGFSDLAFMGVVTVAGYDLDAQAYITAVEAADGQTLETSVRDAINDFVVGCKADGIWNAIKASCIMAGARTLDGALVPLAGTAPTNFNFVSGDYNRKTGLVGNGSTKYLDSNRNNDSDPQNSNHNAVYIQATGAGACLGTVAGTNSGHNLLGFGIVRNRRNVNFSLSISTGLYATSRSSNASFNARASGTTSTASLASETPQNTNISIFRNGTGYGTNRLAFYSIGEALDLALLDARVTTLINAFAAAIP